MGIRTSNLFVILAMNTQIFSRRHRSVSVRKTSFKIAKDTLDTVCCVQRWFGCLSGQASHVRSGVDGHEIWFVTDTALCE
jgi:hypothetical protein